MALSAICLSSTHRVEQNLLKKGSRCQGKIHLLNNKQFTTGFGLASTCAKKNGRIQFLQTKKQFKGQFKVEVDVSIPFTWLHDYL